MLARSVVSEEQWHQDTDKEIFIGDRDGPLFLYVLDYMRKGKVNLPFTVSKDDLVEELDYFGFEDVDESKIIVMGISNSLR